MKEVKHAKDLKQLGHAPDGHTYVGSSLAYWRFSETDASHCYDYCKWESGGKKQQVIVECVPDVDSLRVHQGSGATWSLDDHNSDDCEHCGLIYRRNK